MSKIAVFQAGMDMFSVTAPFVDRPTFFTVHASAPLLQALRFGCAVAFVSSLALWFGGLLAGGRRAEHLHGGVSLRNRNDVGRGHRAGVGQQSIRQLAATLFDLRYHRWRRATVIAPLQRLDCDHEAAGARHLHVIGRPYSAI